MLRVVLAENKHSQRRIYSATNVPYADADKGLYLWAEIKMSRADRATNRGILLRICSKSAKFCPLRSRTDIKWVVKMVCPIIVLASTKLTRKVKNTLDALNIMCNMFKVLTKC